MESRVVPARDQMRPTIASVLSHATERLRDCTDTPRLEAELLLVHVLHSNRLNLYAAPESHLHPEQCRAMQALVERRAAGEPLPYLTGRAEFYGLELLVDNRVLIPRPETERLLDLALELIPQTLSCQVQSALRPAVADVGTGSGCLAIGLAVHMPECRIYATDLSTDALAVASVNAKRHNVSGQIEFLRSDLLTALREPVDFILANPPYIAAEDWSILPREIREHEPRLALHGGCDGLDVFRRLMRQASHHLRPGGGMLVEIGADQGPSAIDLARKNHPRADVALHCDLAGRERVLSVLLPPDRRGGTLPEGTKRDGFPAACL